MENQQRPASSTDAMPELHGQSQQGLEDLKPYLEQAVDFVQEWMDAYGPATPSPAQTIDANSLAGVFNDLKQRLSINYPFFHPRYLGQMLKPPHPAAVIGYLTTMLINPNNHDMDAGAATSRMEQECIDHIAHMFGCSRAEDDLDSPGGAKRRCHLGHLTTSGTVANLEALFVARELHPRKSIAHSADAHYTHGRMSHLLNIASVAVPTDERGRMDLDALENLLKAGGIGTVVLTAGTTGLGAVDPIDKAIPLCRKYGVRVHVDAAYGGFFRLLADEDDDILAPEVAAAFRAIDEADSVVIDPHKHGLQPYGCGAVLFRDPNVANFYDHTSPYTYYTESDDQIHLGEISLECSRSGAAAAALWMTFQLLPPTREGLGRIVRPGREAALKWADLIEESDEYGLFQHPDLDIVSYYPKAEKLSQMDAISGDVLNTGMTLPRDESIFVATYQVDAESMGKRGHSVDADLDSARILRSVTMKPEHLDYIPTAHTKLEGLAAQARTKLGQK